MKYLKAFNYTGIKDSFIPEINSIIENYDFKNYIEPFFGNGALFYNLEYNFQNYVLNDSDINICLIHKSIKQFPYNEYKNQLDFVFNNFGDIKTDKEAFYNFRNYYNKNCSTLRTRGLLLLQLVNSMIKYPVNKSFGKRHYIINEEVYNKLHDKLQKTKIIYCDYKNLINKNIFYDDCFVFLYPQIDCIEQIKNIKGKNSLICYLTDDDKDMLLDYGYTKISISDKTIYLKYLS